MNLKVDLASFKIGRGLILLQFGFSMMKGTAVKIAKARETNEHGLREKVLGLTRTYPKKGRADSPYKNMPR